jgi:hypothetical protein
MSATSAMSGNSSFSPQHITLPPGFQLDFDTSLPSSPYEVYHPVISVPSQQQQLHQQQQLQRLYLEHSRLANETSRLDIDSLSASLKSTQISKPPAQRPHLSSLMKTSSLPASLPSTRPTTTISEKASTSSISQQHHHHPHHPGPICLPPPPNVTFQLPSHVTSHLLPSVNKNQPLHPLSSSYTNNPGLTQSATSANTPHGLPPITPSMPPFTFQPPLTSPGITYHSSTSIRQQQQQPQPIPPSPLYQASFHPAPHPVHQQQQRQPPLPSPGTHPQLHHAMLAATYSPGVAMSPGAFWGRPGEVQNPFINAAVGAPLHHQPLPSPGHPHPAGVYGHAMHSPGGYFYSPHHAGVGVEPKGYFDAMYFPPTGANAASVAALASSGGVAAEIMKDTSQHNVEEDVVEKVEKGVGADGGIQASSSTSSSSPDDQRLSRDKSPQSASSSMAETNATGASWFTKSESGDQDEDREDVVEHGPGAERDQVNKTHSLNASTHSLDSVRGFEDENVISRSRSVSGTQGGKRENGGACGRGEAVVQADPPQGVHRSESDPLQPHGRLLVEQALHAIVSGGTQTILESQPQILVVTPMAEARFRV